MKFTQEQKKIILAGMYGDLMGSGYEGILPRPTKLRFKNLVAGEYTDDTEMTRAVYYVIKLGDFSNRIKYLSAFKMFQNKRQRYSRKTDFCIENGTVNNSDTCGAIMMASPLIAVPEADLVKAVNSMLWYTHQNDSAAQTVADYIRLLKQLILTKDPKTSLDCIQNETVRSRLEFIKAGGPAWFGVKSQVTCLDVLAHAYYFFLKNTGNYKEGLAETIRESIDSDTVAKIYCELVASCSSELDPYTSHEII